MLEKTVILFHVCGAVIGLIAGALSMLFRKGAGLHRAAGTVFFVSMITMSLSAVCIAAVYRPNVGNVTVGLLTFYLVTTSWVAARRREGGTGAFDLAALAIVLGVVMADFTFGIQAARSPHGVKDQIPAAIYFVFGTIALLFATSDVRMIRGGGVTGARRIARHLLRMSFAFLIAVFSLYPGRPQVFPKWLKATNLLYVPHVLVIGAIAFWMVRTLGRKRRRLAESAAVVPETALRNVA
jgi:uncharacterized membrane protein